MQKKQGIGGQNTKCTLGLFTQQRGSPKKTPPRHLRRAFRVTRRIARSPAPRTPRRLVDSDAAPPGWRRAARFRHPPGPRVASWSVAVLSYAFLPSSRPAAPRGSASRRPTLSWARTGLARIASRRPASPTAPRPQATGRPHAPKPRATGRPGSERVRPRRHGRRRRDGGVILKIGCFNMLTRMCRTGRRQHYSGEDRERLVTNHSL